VGPSFFPGFSFFAADLKFPSQQRRAPSCRLDVRAYKIDSDQAGPGRRKSVPLIHPSANGDQSPGPRFAGTSGLAAAVGPTKSDRALAKPASHPAPAILFDIGVRTGDNATSVRVGENASGVGEIVTCK